MLILKCFICLVCLPMCLSCTYQLGRGQEWVDITKCTWRCQQGYYRIDYPYSMCLQCDRDLFLLNARGECSDVSKYYVPCIKDSIIEATKDGTCEYCYNKPLNSRYTYSGTVWNVSSCKWACDAGYYKTGDLCLPCSNGSYSNLFENSILSNGFNSGCILCDPGKYITFDIVIQTQEFFGFTTCLNCVSGKISENYGSSTCYSCQAGWFSPYSGKTRCEWCAVGKYSTSIGSNDYYICKICNAGTYASSKGSSTCTECDAGWYSSGTGSTLCTFCDAGTYTTTSGSKMCVDCASNACDAGLYVLNCSGSNPGQCTGKVCPEGSYYAGPAGCLSCSYCDIGKYAIGCGGISAGSCTACTNLY